MLLLLPDFIKGIAAKSLARKLVNRLNGRIETEGGSSPKIYVKGQHRERKVEVFFAVTWGHTSVTVIMKPKFDLHFHLRSKAGLKSLSSRRHSEYEELDFAPGVFVKCIRDKDQLDVRRVIAGLEPELRERMLSLVKGQSAWSSTADGLQYDHVCSVFGSADRLMNALDLACDVAQGLENQ